MYIIHVHVDMLDLINIDDLCNDQTVQWFKLYAT